MGKRKANRKPPNNAQVEGPNKKECISNSNEQSPALPAPLVHASSSAGAVDELVKAQAALQALESRFAQVVAENQALQAQNKQLQSELIQERQDSSRSRALVRGLTFEMDDLKTELTFLR